MCLVRQLHINGLCPYTKLYNICIRITMYGVTYAHNLHSVLIVCQPKQWFRGSPLGIIKLIWKIKYTETQINQSNICREKKG